MQPPRSGIQCDRPVDASVVKEVKVIVEGGVTCWVPGVGVGSYSWGFLCFYPDYSSYFL